MSRQSSEEPGRSGRSLASAGDVAYASLTPTRSPVFHGHPAASADDPVSAFSNTRVMLLDRTYFLFEWPSV